MKEKKKKFVWPKFCYNLEKIIIPIIVIFLSLSIGTIIIKVMGIDILLVYRIFFKGGSGSIGFIEETLVKATPIILTGLSFAFAFRAGIFNVGAEGQLYMGGVLAALVGTSLQGLPMIIHLPLAIIAAFIGGGLWGLLAGWLKVKFGANEIITTIMLNYVAINVASYLVHGPMRARDLLATYPQGDAIANSAQLPLIFLSNRVHLGFIIALICLVFYYIFFRKTILGYEARVTGQGMNVAKYAGINSARTTLFIMLICGGMAGLAGASEILGVQKRFIERFSPGYGFDGIMVALAGMNSPFGIFLVAILFGILRRGGNLMQMFAGVPVQVIYIIQGLMVIFVVVGQRIKIKNKIIRLK